MVRIELRRFQDLTMGSVANLRQQEYLKEIRRNGDKIKSGNGRNSIVYLATSNIRNKRTLAVASTIAG